MNSSTDSYLLCVYVAHCIINKKKKSNVLLPNVCRFALLFVVCYMRLENQIGHNIQHLAKISYIQSKRDAQIHTDAYECVYVTYTIHTIIVCATYRKPEKKIKTIQQEIMWKKFKRMRMLNEITRTATVATALMQYKKNSNRNMALIDSLAVLGQLIRCIAAFIHFRSFLFSFEIYSVRTY